MYGDGDGFLVGDYGSAQVLRGDGSCEDVGFKVDLSGMDPARLAVGGTFHIECVGRDGVTRWVDDARNAVVATALDDVLNVYLGDTTQSAVWYIGLVDNAGYTAFASADTAASHSGWAENQQYAASTRPAWGNGTSSGGAGSVTNASTVNFAMNATATIRGLFLINNSTKGGTTGQLFSTAAFTGGNQAVNNGDTIKVTYTVTSTAS